MSGWESSQDGTKGCTQSLSSGLDRKYLYLCELWPWWYCRCGGRPLPQPTPHVFLTRGPLLTPPPVAVIWEEGRQRGKKPVKFLLMECQGEPGSDRGQIYHWEIHPGGEKCTQGAVREFAILPHLLCLLTLPLSQWTYEQLHHPSHRRASCILQQFRISPPPHTWPHPPLLRNNVLPKGYQQPDAWSALILSPLHTERRDSLP